MRKRNTKPYNEIKMKVTTSTLVDTKTSIVWHLNTILVDSLKAIEKFREINFQILILKGGFIQLW